MTLALDVDTVRGMLGGWLDEPLAAGLAARKLALAIARTHPLAGHDVLVPQCLGRLDFIVQLDAQAVQVGAAFVEVALICDAEDAVARFVRRSSNPQSPQQRDAQTLQECVGGTPELRQMHQRFLDVIAARPATRTVPTVDGEIGQTFSLLQAAIGE